MTKKSWFAPLCLFLFATLIYAHVVGGDFLRWDDRQNIQLNPFVERALWSQTWTRPYYNMFIPVTYSVWTALWHITPQPWIFHLLNLVLHGGTVVLVYLITRRILKSRPDADRAAIFAAAVFAAHPLQVETVAWISTGRDLLASFLGLAAAYLVLTRERLTWLVAATGLFCLALLSKPSVAVVPVGLALLSWAEGSFTLRRRWTCALWLMPGAAALIATKIIQQLDADLRVPPSPLLDRVLISFDTAGFYLTKLVLPLPLASDYGRTPKWVLANSTWTFGLLAMSVIGVGLYVKRRSFPRVTWAALAWTIVFVGPVLGIVPFQAQGQTTVADRYAYLPMLGVAIVFGMAAARHRRIATAVIVIATAISVTRAEVWRTNSAFFHDMLDKNPDSFVAYSSLGVEYILQQDLPKAERYLNEAVRMKPTDVIPRANLSQLYILLNRPDRVTGEIAPLLDNPEFLRQNQTETRALASAYRLTARSFWMRGLHRPANDFFCRWYHLDWENEDGKAEVARFFRDAADHQVPLEPCS